jgi:hypothetical protein
VRVKSVRPGALIYHWYNLQPLANILSYNVTSNSLQATNPSLSDINQASNQNQLLIYPNPAQNNFTIQTNNADKHTLQLFDINGKLVLSQTINGTSNINTANLPAGVYNLSLQNPNQVVNKRLVIVK